MRACKLVACTKGEKAVEKWQYQLDFPPPPATEAVPHRYGSRSPLLPDRHGGIRVALTDLEPLSSVRRGRRPSRRISAPSCSIIGGAGQSIWPPIFLARDHAGGDEGRVQRHRNGDRQFQRVLDAV